MKRVKELVTLSWEHHDGLVFAFRLQQGLKNSADPETMRAYVVHTWDNELDHHFWQEEQTLSNALKNSETGKELLGQMLGDHEYFRETAALIRTTKHPAPEVIQAFAERLNLHIRFEERDLFPFLEGTLAPDTLAEIGRFLNDHHEKPDKCWADAFWENTSES